MIRYYSLFKLFSRALFIKLTPIFSSPIAYILGHTCPLVHGFEELKRLIFRFKICGLHVKQTLNEIKIEFKRWQWQHRR